MRGVHVQYNVMDMQVQLYALDIQSLYGCSVFENAITPSYTKYVNFMLHIELHCIWVKI
jgi:hypothetical protein